jgi:transposase-like protein
MSRSITSIGITGYKIINQTLRADTLELDLQAPQKQPPGCTRCRSTRIQSKGLYVRKVRHLECFGHSSRLRIRCRRFRCRDCKASFLQQLPGILPGRHSSEPFRENIYSLHHEGISSSAMGRLKKGAPSTVSRIYAQFTERKARERLSLDCPLILGIDEHTLHKKKQFATTFCDLGNRRVFDIVEGKSASDLEGFLSRLNGREKVRMVCIDLCSAFRSLAPRTPRNWCFEDAQVKESGSKNASITSGWYPCFRYARFYCLQYAAFYLFHSRLGKNSRSQTTHQPSRKTIRLKNCPCIWVASRHACMKYGGLLASFVTKSNPVEEKRSNIVVGVASSSGS